MARFNVGGGNASNVAYGYPFMRQGAAVPGYWGDDADGRKGIYKGTTTNQKDKVALDEAFDPTDDSNYDWGKGFAQEWWVKRGAEIGDISRWETFANSAPWFMTESGYATGGTNFLVQQPQGPQEICTVPGKGNPTPQGHLPHQRRYG